MKDQGKHRVEPNQKIERFALEGIELFVPWEGTVNFHYLILFLLLHNPSLFKRLFFSVLHLQESK